MTTPPLDVGAATRLLERYVRTLAAHAEFYGRAAAKHDEPTRSDWLRAGGESERESALLTELASQLSRLVEADGEAEKWRGRFLRYAKCSGGCALNRNVGVHHCTCGFVEVMNELCALNDITDRAIADRAARAAREGL